MNRPRMIVVAGPSGSGKTTSFPVTDFGLDAFNVDDRCAQLLGSYRAIPREVRRVIAAECENFVMSHIQDGVSFAVETTLRTTAALNQAQLAHSHGFSTVLIYVATDSLAENIKRVLQRAQAGGHGASERDIRAIHEASLANLSEAIAAFQLALVYDSTARWTAPTLVATAQNGTLIRHGASPLWLKRALSKRTP